MNLLFLILSLALSLVGAYTDIRYGRVKNKHLIVALSIWMLCMLAGIASQKIILHVDAAIRFFVNLFFACIFALYFYVKDIWAPGDAKIFLSLTVIYPLPMYAVRFGNVFPSLNFIVFSFAAGYIWLIAASLFKTKKNQFTWKEIQPSPLNRSMLYHLLGRLGLAAGVSVMLQKTMPVIYYENQALFSIVIILLLSFNEKQNKQVKEIVCTAGILCFAALMTLGKMWHSAIHVVLQSIVIVLLFDFLNQKVRKNSYQEISIDAVKPGIILSYATIWKMQNCIDPELPAATTENRRSRLNEQQAQAVKRWCRNAKQNVTIVRMLPFVPFVAFSVGIEILRFCLFTS